LCRISVISLFINNQLSITAFIAFCGIFVVCTGAVLYVYASSIMDSERTV